MDQTDSQLLPFPEDNDFAAGALQLQALAQAIDAKLVSLNARFDDVLNRPVFIRRNSTTQNVGANNGVSINVPQVVFQSFDTGTSSSTVRLNAWPTGIYVCGGYVNTNPIGAVNANSAKLVYLQFVDRRIKPGPLNDSYTESWGHTGNQTNTGGDHTTFVETFEVHGPEGASVRMELLHGNTSSNLSVINAVLWMVRVGDLAL
jgi:hypothetical protein